MEIFKNPLKGKGLTSEKGMAPGDMFHDASAARALYAQCPIAHETPLFESAQLAEKCGVGKVFIKDERERLGLGSFKAVGATFAIAKQADKKSNGNASATSLNGETFVCASAGNHGLSMAAGARIFGARAVVYLADTVPEGFADRLREKGAEVVREGDNYEASLEASIKAADDNGWQLLADGTWEDYFEPARDVMEGYLIMGNEMADQMDAAPSHIFLQAGVGGLASAAASAVRHCWGGDVTIIVVEPTAAPALIESVRHDRVMETEGPVSNMGRLDCKIPSHLSLKYLAQEADYFLTIEDDKVAKSIDELAAMDLATTPSGGAGVAALMNLSDADKAQLGLTASSSAAFIISECV